jgi:hypothetical protein
MGAECFSSVGFLSTTPYPEVCCVASGALSNSQFNNLDKIYKKKFYGIHLLKKWETYACLKDLKLKSALIRLL